MQYVGIDWACRRAAWCAVSDGGAISGEGVVPADEDGLARLVLTVGVRDRLACGCTRAARQGVLGAALTALGATQALSI